MPADEATDSSLRAENAELRARLEEAEDMIRAIRGGGVDALVVEGDAGPQLFTLQGLDAEQSRVRGEMLAQVIDAVIAVDSEERVTFLNAAAERQYGVRAGDMLGRPIAEVFTQSWAGTDAEAAMRTALRGRGEWRGELIHRTPDGRELHVEAGATTLRDPDGACSGYVMAIRDIRERKQAAAVLAQALTKAEEGDRLLGALMEHVPEGITIADAPDVTIRMVSRAGRELTGKPREVIEGIPVWEHTAKWDIYCADGVTIARNEDLPLTRAVHQGEVVIGEEWVLGHPDGRRIPILCNAAPIRDTSDKVVSGVIAWRDITQHKQAEAALRLTNERFDLAVKCSQVVLFQQDLELRYTWLQNPASGFEADAVGKRDADLMERAEDAAKVEALKREVIRSGVGQRQEVVVHIHGVGRHFDLLMEPLRDAAGLISGVTCAAIDMTERKRAEGAIARLAAIVESSHDALFGEDLDGIITSWNRGAEQIFGFSADEIVGTSIMRLIPADRQAAEHELQRQIAAGERGGTFEAIRQTKGGREFPASVTISPLKDAAGKVIGTARAVRDITERKRAEAALRESEQQYSALASASSDVAYRMSADWSSMLPLDGRDLVPSSDQPLGDWAWLDRNVPRDEHARVRQAISEAIARKTFFELEHRIRRPDGSIGWTFSRAVPILDENEGVIAWFGSASDITGRKAAEEALRASEEFNRSLLAGSADCVKILDVDGRLLQMNAAALCLMEIEDFGPLAGQEWAGLWPAEARPDIARAVATARDGDTCGFQAFCPTAKGTPRWWDVVVSPVRNADDGQVVRLLSVSRDLTERKRGEQALRDNAIMLADLDRRKDRFLSMLSHELRNPLGVIVSSLHLLRFTDHDRNAVQQGCARMERQVVVLTRLIDDLMDVGRINQDKLTLHTERLDLATVAQSALENSRTVLDQRGHTVTIVLPPQPIEVDGDATRLAQVVSNLLTNASKYSDPGHPIELTVERQGDVAAVAVRDRGIGIAPDDLSRVFELFAQVSGAAHLAQGGLGIGLHLVQRVVELHGGSVEARSDGLGQGSEFLVRLPLASSGARTERPADGEVLSPSPFRRYRILVADDNEDAVTTLALLLSQLGHDVRTAKDGAEAVAVAATFQPDVALLDIGMPELDGHEACRLIRTQPGGDTMVLVAVSGWGQDEDKRRARAAGFQHHLVKPVDPVALTAVLQALALT